MLRVFSWWEPGLTKVKIMTGRSARSASHARPQPRAYMSSREELQFLNDELNARNRQLQEAVEQERATASDLHNILNSTNVATLLLGADLRIRFFTPAAGSLFDVIASDVGRPLADLTRRFADDDLLTDARAVLVTQAPVRREVRADDGGWFMRAMLPYRGDERCIEGVVITFADISEMKAAEKPVGHEDLLVSVKHALDQIRDTAKLSAWRETAAKQVASLTGRQRQILDLVLAGHPSKNIAADLGINQRTVDNHRAAIMRKTGSKSLPALIRTALAAA
jgi:DNA-binding CsgD family transcriptional regulator/PAS domain-containing protein